MLLRLDDGGHVPAAAVPRPRRAERRASATCTPRRGRSRSTCSLINVFVLPIAFAGLLIFRRGGGGRQLHPRSCRSARARALIAVVVFLGGFSAATAMIVVDSLALSKMITNDIVLPILLRRQVEEDLLDDASPPRASAILGVVTLGLRLGAHGARAVPAGGDGAAVVHRRRPSARPPCSSGSTGGAATGRARSPASRRASRMWFYTLILPALVREGVLPLASSPTGRSGRVAPPDRAARRSPGSTP